MCLCVRAPAIAVGNLHIARPEWEDDSLEWLLGGAYRDIGPSVDLLGELPTLTLWGRQDEVIPPAQLGSWPAARMVQALPSANFRWVETSGHTPHLEQPAFTSAALVSFLQGDDISGDSDVSEVVAAATRYDAMAEKTRDLADTGKAKLRDFGQALANRARQALDERR